MSICCLWKGEVTFFPIILKMAASSADEMRDRGEHSDWLITHNLDFVLLLSPEIWNMISVRFESGKLFSSTCHRTLYNILPVMKTYELMISPFTFQT